MKTAKSRSNLSLQELLAESKRLCTQEPSFDCCNCDRCPTLFCNVFVDIGTLYANTKQGEDVHTMIQNELVRLLTVTENVDAHARAFAYIILTDPDIPCTPEASATLTAFMQTLEYVKIKELLQTIIH